MSSCSPELVFEWEQCGLELLLRDVLRPFGQAKGLFSVLAGMAEEPTNLRPKGS